MEKLCSQLSGVDLEGKLVPIPCQGHACEHYVHIFGHDPQTDQPVDQWGCAFNAQWRVGLEVAKQSRQTGASVESFRNEMVRQNVQLINMAAQSTLEGKANGESDDHSR